MLDVWGQTAAVRMACCLLIDRDRAGGDSGGHSPRVVSVHRSADVIVLWLNTQRPERAREPGGDRFDQTVHHRARPRTWRDELAKQLLDAGLVEARWWDSRHQIAAITEPMNVYAIQQLLEGAVADEGRSERDERHRAGGKVSGGERSQPRP